MMTDWVQKATDALRMLCELYYKGPDELSEPELQQYFLHCKNVDGCSPNTLRICYCGIRHRYTHLLQRDWHTLALIRAQRERRLPAVLSVPEVRSVLGCVRAPHNRAFLVTVYACGLQEAQHLEVADIDSQRMLLHVHRGNGARTASCPCRPRHCQVCTSTGEPIAIPGLSSPPWTGAQPGCCGRYAHERSSPVDPPVGDPSRAEAPVDGLAMGVGGAGGARRCQRVPSVARCVVENLAEAGRKPTRSAAGCWTCWTTWPSPSAQPCRPRPPSTAN